jgi:uncharacterized protein (TIGR02444 family)
MDDNANSLGFWRFTTSAYEKEGVQTGVIMLQEEHSADVNVLFLCCYVAATQRGRLTTEDLRTIEDSIDSWKTNVTQRLRGVRNQIKENRDLSCLRGSNEVRARVLSAEIESERVTQELLESLFANRAVNAGAPVLADAVFNLSSYLATISRALDSAAENAIAALLRATIITEPGEIEAAMRFDPACGEK